MVYSLYLIFHSTKLGEYGIQYSQALASDESRYVFKVDGAVLEEATLPFLVCLPSQGVSTLKGKNLLPEEHILSFYRRPPRVCSSGKLLILQ